MRARCAKPHHPSYANYGGRGIVVCPEWASFDAFIRDMGPRPSPQHTLERSDNAGPYAQWNCRWATRKEQARNLRRNRILEMDGQQACLAEWAERLGVSQNVLWHRLDKAGGDFRAVVNGLA